MSKKATETNETQQTEECGAPAYIEELLKNGTTIITAKSRDELAKIVNDIPAEVHYGAGAVGFNHETGAFTLRVDIVKI